MNSRIGRPLIAFVITMILGAFAGSVSAGGLLALEFEDAVFSDPLTIDNSYWPLNPDFVPRTFTYLGETEDECVINQVSYAGGTYTLTTTDTASPYYLFVTVEIVDKEWVFEDVDDCDVSLLSTAEAEEALAEQTLDRYAQDDQDNIWYLGEYSQSFEDECSDYDFMEPGVPAECLEGSWEAGIDFFPDSDEDVIGEAGIVVPGDEPIMGEPLTPGTFYMQEVAEGAEDMAKILRLGAAVSTDFLEDGEDCRKVKEWNPFERGASVEHKFYCPGPGLVLIKGVGGGRTEVEELVDIEPPL